MPQISVIVPVYKVEPYLRRCVDSILGQTFADFELILVDDGSPDGCPDICDEYASRDPRVVVIHQKNGGLSAARNTGIDWAFANSDSQWLTFIDSDDWVHPEYLQILITEAAESRCRIAACSLLSTDTLLPFQSAPVDSKTLNSRNFYISENSCAIPACGKLYEKQLFFDIRYPLGRLHEDEFTTYKLLFKTDKIVFVSNSLYYYFYNQMGITKSDWHSKRLDALDACDERIGYFQHRNDLEMVQHSLVTMLSYIHLAKEKISHSSDPALVRTNSRVLMHYVRKFLSRHRELSVTDIPGIFEFAYPKTMWLYWHMNALRNKLRLHK